MADFSYSAFDRSGKKVSGSIDAENKAQAVSLIKKKGLRPIEIIEGKTQKKSFNIELPKFNFKSHKATALSFLKQVLQLHSGGMPIGDAIRILQQRLHNKEQKQIAKNVWKDLSEGLTLSQALRKFPLIFDESILSPIEAGEATGHLAPILQDIIDQLSASIALRKKILSGLSYPIFICLVAFAVIGIFLFFLLPKIQGMMSSLGGKMTLSARILIGSANFMLKGGPFLLVAAIVGLILFLQWRRTQIGRYTSDGWALKTPLLGKLILFSEICKTSNLMATLLGSGVNATQSMQLTEKSILNSVLRKRFKTARQTINDGLSFSKSFEKFDVFPDMAIDILTVGDSTGDMVHSFREIYKIYTERLTQLLQFMTTMISSVALGFAFGLVTLLALSIVGSVLQFSNTLLSH